MDYKGLETLAYAEGYIEDFIEDYTNVGDLPMEPEEAEHRKQILNMWQVLSTGLADLRRENSILGLKVDLVRQALDT
jgi:hypothetical protein